MTPEQIRSRIAESDEPIAYYEKEIKGAIAERRRFICLSSLFLLISASLYFDRIYYPLGIIGTFCVLVLIYALCNLSAAQINRVKATKAEWEGVRSEYEKLLRRF